MITADTARSLQRPGAPGRRSAPLPALPKTLRTAVVLCAAGVGLTLAAFRLDWPGFGDAVFWQYCLGLLYLGALLFWESTRPRVGALPSWTSPPALIAGWTLAWIYGPALVTFFDEGLLGEIEMTHGGASVLLSGLFLTCVALGVLSLAFHGMASIVGGGAVNPRHSERTLALSRIVGLYLVSAAARTVHLLTVGLVYGTDITAWGALQPVAQWIGYLEDLRFLALALLVAHVVRRAAGYVWVVIPLLIELVLGLSSGFLMPVILPVVLCVATAVAVDRFRTRHLVLMVSAAIVVSTFVPVIAAIRQDRLGTIGTTDFAGVAEALTIPGRYWVSGVASGDGVYDKFFGRQAEVASAAGLVRALTPDVVPFEGLDQLLTLPAGLVPRVLWPDKPTLSRGVWFSSAFRGLAEDTTSYSAMTIFSEGYLFYGWTGVVLSMLIAGAALALVRRWLDTPRLALVYLALVPTVLQVEPEFSSYFVTLVQRSIVFAAAFVVLTHSRRLAPPRTAIVR